MKFRKNIIPRTVGDVGACAFVSIMIPITYLFAVYVSLPNVHNVGSTWYYVHLVAMTLLLINVVGAFVAVIIVDSSTKSVFIQSTLLPNWRFCAVCEAVSPPRSWHCNVCNTCILKRDHHCIFTGNCIGHYNQRFFLMFLFYMCIGTAYATRFNSVLIWQNLDFSSPLLVFKMMFPFAVMAFGIDASENQCFMLIFLVNIVGMFFCGFLAYYHFQCLLRGSVSYEMNRNILDYNMGVKQNVAMVFGNRWFISWLSPFIPSELPHDGINWESKKRENSKNR